MSGAPQRIGFDTEGRGLLLTKRVPYRHDLHEVKNFLAVLTADGINVKDDFLEIWTCPEEKERIARILADVGVTPSDRIAAIHPFSAVTQRGWPLENYAELAARLRREGNFRTLIVGGPGDVGTFAAVKHLFGDNTIDLVGKCSLRDTIPLLIRCSLFVGNDSGIMHLAAAAGTPLVALFGPQSPVKFGPWSTRAKVIYKGMACSPCRQKFYSECEPSARMRPACMEAISVEEVFQESMKITGSTSKEASEPV